MHDCMRDGGREERIRPRLVVRGREKENNREGVGSYEPGRIQHLKEGDGMVELHRDVREFSVE